MKAKNNPLLSITRVSLAAVICMACSASAASNSWDAADGTWDIIATNWSGLTTWTNGDDAVFSNTNAATTITLSSGLTAGSVMVGNGTSNANYAFTGSELSATSFTVLGTGGDLTEVPTAALNNASITLSGALNIGRAYLNITGSSTVSADTIGSPAGGDGPGAWGTLTIADTASVTATNGFSIGTTAWGLNLNGGTLTTKNLSYTPHNYNGTTNLNFNGTLIKANQNNANFIVVGPGGLDSGFNPSIGAGGAKFDTNSHTIGIGLGLQGTGALTKSGTGTLNLNVASSYSGGTTVNGGTLSLTHEPIGIANTAIGAMTSSNTATINNGGTLTGTKNNWLGNTSLASGGSNAISVIVNQGGTLKGGGGTVTGLGNVTLAGGTIEVSNGLGAFGWFASFTLGGDITVSGSTASAITTASGAGGTANIYLANGSNGTGGTRLLTVGNVTGDAASDLLISARFALGTLVKKGLGTVEITAGETGTQFPATWEIEAGSFLLAEPATFEIRVTDSSSNRVLEASGGNGSATFNGTLNINTSAVTLTTGNTWSLIDVAGLGATFGANFAVSGGFSDPDTNGIWTKTDALGDWSFSETTGDLTLVGGSDYDTWKSDNGVTGGPDADDDNDGLTNFEEYAFGLDPTGGASVNPIAVALDKTSKTFSYTRRTISLPNPALDYTVWFSTDLAIWTEDSGAVELITGTSGDVQTVQVTLSALPGDPLPGKLFIRVQAEQP